MRGSSCLASPVATGEVASNASRWGRLCLAFISDTMKVYGLRPWRPLRHTACATSPASAGEALGYNGIIASPVATGEVASMRADGGRSWLACTSNAMKVYSLRSWRPLHRLRGPPPPLWQGRLEVHSVPLRGYGFEIIAALSGCRGPFSFPSPCGDMVLKSACVALLQLVYGTEFPSPCGDMVLKCPLRRDALLCLAQYAVLRRGCIFPPFHGDTAF